MQPTEIRTEIRMLIVELIIKYLTSQSSEQRGSASYVPTTAKSDSLFGAVSAELDNFLGGRGDQIPSTCDFDILFVRFDSFFNASSSTAICDFIWGLNDELTINQGVNELIVILLLLWLYYNVQLPTQHTGMTIESAQIDLLTNSPTTNKPLDPYQVDAKLIIFLLNLLYILRHPHSNSFDSLARNTYTTYTWENNHAFTIMIPVLIPVLIIILIKLILAMPPDRVGNSELLGAPVSQALFAVILKLLANIPANSVGNSELLGAPVDQVLVVVILKLLANIPANSVGNSELLGAPVDQVLVVFILELLAIISANSVGNSMNSAYSYPYPYPNFHNLPFEGMYVNEFLKWFSQKLQTRPRI